jgi:hypothetical protein
MDRVTRLGRIVCVAASPAPEPLSWDWWTQLIIPLLSALASTFVGVVAIWVALRLAKMDRHERDREARLKVVSSVQDSLREFLSVRPQDGPAAERAALAFATALNGALARQGTDAVELEGWLRLEGQRVAADITNNPQSTQSSWTAFQFQVVSNLTSWQYGLPLRPVGVTRLPDEI